MEKILEKDLGGSYTDLSVEEKEIDEYVVRSTLQIKRVTPNNFILQFHNETFDENLNEVLFWYNIRLCQGDLNDINRCLQSLNLIEK